MRRPGARDLRARDRGPTRRDRRRSRRRRPRRARRRGRAPGRACSRRRGRPRYIGCSGSIASGTSAWRAYGKSAAMPSRTCARASARSREPFGSPPTTRTRHCAPMRGRLVDGAAVVVERRLPTGLVGGRKHAAAAEPGDGEAVIADELAGALGAAGLHDVAPRRDRRDAGARAAFDQLFERPCLHGHRIDREQRAIVREKSRMIVLLPRGATSPLPPPASACERWGGRGGGRFAAESSPHP